MPARSCDFMFTANNIQKIQDRNDCVNACKPRNCCFTSEFETNKARNSYEEQKTNCNVDNQEQCNIFKAYKTPLDLLEFFNSSGDSERDFGKDRETYLFIDN